MNRIPGCCCAPVGSFNGRLLLPRALLTSVFLTLLYAPFATASGLKADESVILFPTSAHAENDKWLIPLHGWMFELETDSWWRSALMDTLLDSLGASNEIVHQEPFRSRARMFLVDNERGKQIDIDVGGLRHTTPPSGANGHFVSQLRIPRGRPTGAPVQWLRVAVDAGASGARVSGGRVQLLGERGVSIISDIDDTIKHSEVLDKSALLTNTFLRPFAPVPGMAALYSEWARAGAGFHYVSASPWQLYPALKEFMKDADFPAGSIHLKMFRLKDSSVMNLLASSEKTKPPVIRALLLRYPQRRFVLVGDSGEHDPEIYAAIAREFPDQVEAIYIRNIDDSDVAPNRLQAAFAGLPESLWTLFDDPGKLPAPTVLTSPVAGAVLPFGR